LVNDIAAGDGNVANLFYSAEQGLLYLYFFEESNACLLVMFRLILDGRIGTGPLILMQQPCCGLILCLVASGGEAAVSPGGWSGTVMAFYLDSHLI
jgi:hypothetical protein